MVFVSVVKSTDVPGPSVYHCSAIVKDKLYILSGLKAIKNQSELVYVLDLKTMQWKAVKPNGKIPTSRCLASSVVVGHKVFVFGGYQITSNGTHKCFNGMYSFDTETHTWEHLETTGLTPDPRAGASMVFFKGRLWLYGGSQGRHIFFGDMFSFDLKTYEWSVVSVTTGEYPMRRCCHSASVIGNTMYVFGGITSDSEYKNQKLSNDIYRFEFSLMEWIKESSIKTPIPSPRCCHACLTLSTCFIIACGGDLLAPHSSATMTGSTYQTFQQSIKEGKRVTTAAELETSFDYENSIYMYHVLEHKWTKLKTSMSSKSLPRCLGLSVDFDPIHRQLLFFGGKLKSGTPLNTLLSLQSSQLSIQFDAITQRQEYMESLAEEFSHKFTEEELKPIGASTGSSEFNPRARSASNATATTSTSSAPSSSLKAPQRYSQNLTEDSGNMFVPQDEYRHYGHTGQGRHLGLELFGEANQNEERVQKKMQALNLEDSSVARRRVPKQQTPGTPTKRHSIDTPSTPSNDFRYTDELTTMPKQKKGLFRLFKK